MVKISEIRGQETFVAWLEELPHEKAARVAVKAGLRLLPIFWLWALIGQERRSPFRGTRPTQWYLVNTLHLALASQLNLVGTKSQNQRLLRGIAAIGANPKENSPLMSQDSVAIGYGYSGPDPRVRPYQVGQAYVSAIEQYDFEFSELGINLTDAPESVEISLQTLSRDPRLHVEKWGFDDVAGRKWLWSRNQNPLEQVWLEVRHHTLMAKKEIEGGDRGLTDSDWSFWIDWYQSLLDGRPMLGDADRTLEMLTKIALIDPEVWEQGPEAANPVIRRIWEIYRLRTEVAALQAEKAALVAAQASEARRGHNQPPEGLVDDAPEVAQQVTFIWDGLDDASKELEKDVPDRATLLRIGRKMQTALEAALSYCAKVGDTVIVAGAKTLGAGGGAFLIDYVAMNGRLAQFIKYLISFGLGG